MDKPDANPGRKKKPALNRGEVSALLKLMTSLGIVVTLTIVFFFWVGLTLERRYGLGGVGVPAGLLAGVGLSIYWSYLRIHRHMAQYAPDVFNPERKPGQRDNTHRDADADAGVDDPWYDKPDDA